MRKTAVALALLSLLTGCKEKKHTRTIIATKPVKEVSQAPVRSQEYTQEADFALSGSALHCTIHRQPADSLKKVKDESGQLFVDNEVSLSLTRKDGSVFLKRTFTKASFDECLDDDFRKRGILMGFVFEKVEDNRAYFAASVSHPLADDEYIPIRVTITPQGGVTIERDTQMDTNGEEEEGQ